MTERKVTIASLAAVGLVAMGAGLLAQQSGSQGAGRSGQSVPQKAVTADQGLKILIEARIAIAREILAQDLARLQHLGGGAGDLFAEIPFWSHWLMVDRLRIAATEAEAPGGDSRAQAPDEGSGTTGARVCKDRARPRL